MVLCLSLSWNLVNWVKQKEQTVVLIVKQSLPILIYSTDMKVDHELEKTSEECNFKCFSLSCWWEFLAISSVCSKFPKCVEVARVVNNPTHSSSNIQATLHTVVCTWAQFNVFYRGWCSAGKNSVWETPMTAHTERIIFVLIVLVKIPCRITPLFWND